MPAPEGRMLASPAPSFVILTDLLMVTLPYSPVLTTLISPPAAVCVSAWAKVAQAWGTVEQLLASLPVPETKLLLLSAWAGVPCKSASTAPSVIIAVLATNLVMVIRPLSAADHRVLEIE